MPRLARLCSALVLLVAAGAVVRPVRASGNAAAGLPWSGLCLLQITTAVQVTTAVSPGGDGAQRAEGFRVLAHPTTSAGPAHSTKPKDEAWEQATGVAEDARGDLNNFLVGVAANVAAVVASLVFLSCFRKVYPQIFANNTRTRAEGGLEFAIPFKPSEAFFSWLLASYRAPHESLRTCGVGVDCILLLEYSSFACRLLTWLAVPLVLVLMPLHAVWGGAGEADLLGMIGINNVQNGSWIYWIHALAVCYVVAVGERLLFQEMRNFQHVRFRWLLDLEPPRSTTVLVEGLPEPHCSDTALKEYFQMLFPGAVEQACVVRHTGHLKVLVESLKNRKLALEKARFMKAKVDVSIVDEKREAKALEAGGVSPQADGSRPPMTKKHAKLDASRANLETDVKNLDQEVQELQTEARAERKRILEDGELPMVQQTNLFGEVENVLSEKARSVNTSSGFVTFLSEREAMLALNMRCNADVENFMMSIPPEPSNVIYEDLGVPLFRQKLWGLVGYALIFGVFWSYLPFIVLISSFTRLQALRSSFPMVDNMIKAFPFAKMLLEGLLSTLALVVFMSFLPTIFMWVFRVCFCLRSHAGEQLKLQVWYFWFMMVFVVFITALGGSMIVTMAVVVDHPMKFFVLLADSLPTSTHFYLNFLVLQVGAQFVNLCRLPQLFTYWGLRAVLSEDRAVELCEPEDQDYHGMGGRSARFTVNLAIAVVFGILNPMILLVGLVGFVGCRLVFGYLILFAETPKHDLGGAFFVQQLWHMQAALVMFNCLMIGVFYRRAENSGVVVAASLSLAYLLYCVHRFNAFSWEQLPFEEWCSPEAVQGAEEEMARYRKRGDKAPRYVQPELHEEHWEVQRSVNQAALVASRSARFDEARKRATVQWGKVRGSIMMRNEVREFDRRRSS